MCKLNAAPLARFVVLLSVLAMFGSGAVAAGHLHEDDDVRHDCALCAAGSLNPSVDPQSAPSPCLTPAPSLLPGPQGPSRGMLYRAHLLSRAPPAFVYFTIAPHGIARRAPLFATASLVRAPW